MDGSVQFQTVESVHDKTGGSNSIDQLGNFNDYSVVEALPNRSVTVAGVRVSIRPEAIFRMDSDKFGMLKLCFSKTRPLTADEGKYIAAMLYEFAADMGAEGVPDRERCIALDVFAGEAYVAPRSYKRFVKDVEVACSVISTLWPNV